MSPPPLGVSFVVPVRNGARWLREVASRIFSQADGRPCEVLFIDDGSTDGSDAILRELAQRPQVRVLQGGGRGAAAALNLGLAHAQHPVLCQVDQDVLLEPGWMQALVGELQRSPEAAAAQGWYVTPRDGSLWARVMGLDLEERYHRLTSPHLDHVCSGNTAYRRAALEAIGGFDARMGYGYDNDVSYRLARAGWKLAFVRGARSVHRWREALGGYLRQQYGVGYGRLDLIQRHPRRVAGDQVSGLRMILRVPALALLLALGTLAALTGSTGAGGVVVGLLAALVLERLVASHAAWRRLGAKEAWLFPVVHLLRDAAWLGATAVWVLRRLTGGGTTPSQSMPT